MSLTTTRIDKAAEKISRVYQKWGNLEKSRKGESATQRKKRQRFEKELDALCDMSKEFTERGIRTDRLRSDNDEKAGISLLRDQRQRKRRKMHRDLIFGTLRNHKKNEVSRTMCSMCTLCELEHVAHGS